MQSILGQTITVGKNRVLRNAVVVFVGDRGVGAMFEDGSCEMVVWSKVVFADVEAATLAVSSKSSVSSYMAHLPA